VIQDVRNDGDSVSVSVLFAVVFILSVGYVQHSSQSMIIRVIFSGQVEVVRCSFIAGMLLCCAEWHSL